MSDAPQPGSQTSAAYDFTYNQKIHQGLSEAEARAAAYAAHIAAVWGENCPKDRHGNFIPQGVGSDANPSVNHWVALKKRELQGLESPGTYDRLVRALFKKDRQTALRLGLTEPRIS